MLELEQNEQKKQNIVTTITNHTNKLSFVSSDLSKLDSKCSALGLASKMASGQSSYKEKKQFLAMTLINSKNNYVNFSTTKTQPQLSRMAFPYFLQDDILPQKETKKKKIPKITNRVFSKKHEPATEYDYNFNKIANEEPPINQFLSYDLSRDINNGLFQVKVLAQEIKKIKQDKQELLEDRDKYKPTNKIRINKSFRQGIVGKNWGKSGEVAETRQKVKFR